MSDEQAGPPTPPPWAPPTQSPPTQPDVPTVPTQPVATPPYAPPPPSASGWPPPSPGAPPLGGAPPGGWTAPGAPSPPEPTSSGSGCGRTVAIVAGLVIVLLLVLGAAGAFFLLAADSSELELSIDTCDVAADGSLSATGTIANRAGETEAQIEVRFIDVDGGQQVDSDRITVQIPGEAAERWSTTGVADDGVQQVTCDVTAGE